MNPEFTVKLANGGKRIAIRHVKPGMRIVCYRDDLTKTVGTVRYVVEYPADGIAAFVKRVSPNHLVRQINTFKDGTWTPNSGPRSAQEWGAAQHLSAHVERSTPQFLYNLVMDEPNLSLPIPGIHAVATTLDQDLHGLQPDANGIIHIRQQSGVCVLPNRLIKF